MKSTEEHAKTTVDEETETTVHTVAIARCNGSLLVTPEHLLVNIEAREQVFFLSVDAGNLVLFFPEALFEETGREIELNEGEAHGPLTVRQDLKSGCYPYAVFERRTQDSGAEYIDPTVIGYRR